MFKKISIILALLVVALVFNGCNDPGKDKNTTADTTNNQEPIIISTDLVKNSVALYSIVRADKASETIVSNIQKLKTQLDKKTGANFTLGSDWYRDGDTTIGDKLEILVGDTNRPEYKQALSLLKYDDYSITKIGNKIVIAAHTEDNVTKAVNLFIKNINDCIITNAENKTDVIISSDWYYTFKATYSLEDIFIGTVSVKEYNIIIANKAKASEINAAQLVQKSIAQKCGYVIPISSDLISAIENEIVVGKTDRTESKTYYNGSPNVLNFIIKSDNSKLVFGFGGYTASVNVVKAFDEILTTSKTGDNATINNLDVNTTLNPDYLPSSELAPGATMRIMSTNVLFDKVSIELRAEIFEDYYRIYQPDTIGLQEMIREWQNALFPLVSDLYAVCNPMPSDGVINYTPILYLKDKYTLIESGVKRFRTGRNPWLVTWAVFENKQTGEKFIHCNTHYTVVTDSDRASNPTWTNATKGVEWRLEDAEVVRAKVLELQANYNNIPAVITGDFNSNQFSQEYGKLKYETDIQTSMLVTTISSMKDYRSYHTLGVADRGANDGNSIDHVMITTSTIEAYVHKILYDEIIIHASDHCPVYADIAFK